jgi:phage N-6-adenine-methyltransferase
MITNGLMTSLSDEWATPQELFNELNQEFDFDLDVCADDWNYKCSRYFTREIDGLSQDWNGKVWMNPPYGRAIGKWMAKAYEASRGGATVVCLVPARSDTAWWHDYSMKGEIRFIRGRIKFVSRTGVKDAAPFPSAIVIFRGANG